MWKKPQHAGLEGNKDHIVDWEAYIHCCTELYRKEIKGNTTEWGEIEFNPRIRLFVLKEEISSTTELWRKE